MPKVVDRAERRRAIAEALLRLVARDGIDAVSVRTVAAEAGISAGAVQKYFATREELLGFAFELTGEYLLERWATVATTGPLIDVLWRYVRAALPVDEQSRAEFVVILAFTAQAATRPDWAAKLRADYDWAHRMTVEFIEHAQRTGEIRDDLPAVQLADLVQGLTDGFSDRMLHTRPRSAANRRLLASLERGLRDLLAPR
ncbi:TetR/AcrR family transcriptional regulator [Amycolatopsis anabasis]|uniref:TetR/AcrR family transcriptional regulator n=1 Tax=Amycolatopsis anabasis TaxID=1840409 RepID=UPI00131B3A6E|nr:TetR family transcriptional regulator C-terminal domain-containing protein [Amycolatopsis anabasis]